MRMNVLRIAERMKARESKVRYGVDLTSFIEDKGEAAIDDEGASSLRLSS
jgi:hypothetical protein